jgi:hypothetical protein
MGAFFFWEEEVWLSRHFFVVVVYFFGGWGLCLLFVTGTEQAQLSSSNVLQLLVRISTYQVCTV